MRKNRDMSLESRETHKGEDSTAQSQLRRELLEASPRVRALRTMDRRIPIFEQDDKVLGLPRFLLVHPLILGLDRMPFWGPWANGFV